MSFSSLRSSSLLYILNREGIPSVSIGSVIGTSTPVNKIGLPASFGNMQDSVIDITVKVDDKQGVFYKVPANLDSWEYEQNGIKTPYILATTKEAINGDINALRQQAVGVLNSVEHNKKVVSACDQLLQQLNPEYAEKQRQEQEIAELKSQMAAQQSQMAELIALLKNRESKEGKESAKEEKSSKNK